VSSPAQLPENSVARAWVCAQRPSIRILRRVRPLLISAALALAFALGLRTGLAEIVAPQTGSSITQTDLFGYLFVPPQPGDWLRYDISLNGNLLVTKTIGFGADNLPSGRSAFFEVQTQTPGLAAVPVSSQAIAGGNITWKMFVDAPDFNDSLRQYSFAGGVIKIGDSFFRLGEGPVTSTTSSYHQTLESLLLFGLLPMPDAREGTVLASQPEDVQLGGATLHTVHTTADFSQRSLGGETGLPQTRVETWQTTDVPLGLVRFVVAESDSVFTMNLVAFGRNSYHEIITKDIESVPYFPGS
jgi:hypothetical protein